MEIEKCDCQKCNNYKVEVYTKLCKECRNDFLEEYYKEQDRLREEEFESIKRDGY